MPKTVWVDFVNSPHVLILEPIVRELGRRHFNVVNTARDFSQTLGLLEQKGIQHSAFGSHGGKTRLGKAVALVRRVMRLMVFAAQRDIDLSLCHGSREMIIVSKLLGIPNVTMFDYEYTEHYIKNWGSTLMMVPDAIPLDRLSSLGFRMEKVYRYPGLKEQIYLDAPHFDPQYVDSLGIDPQKVLMVFRPPAVFGHYHNSVSETLVRPLLDYLNRPDVSVIVLPRYPSQAVELKRLSADMHNPLILFDAPIDGPKLLAHADGCISGGGTMIREAAVLNTPAYSIFSGQPGSVDEFLERNGRLVWIRNEADLTKVRLTKRPQSESTETNHSLVATVCDRMLAVLDD